MIHKLYLNKAIQNMGNRYDRELLFPIRWSVKSSLIRHQSTDPAGMSLDTGGRMALALALAVGRQAGSQEAGFCAHWGFASAPLSWHLPWACARAATASWKFASYSCAVWSFLELPQHPLGASSSRRPCTQARAAAWAPCSEGLGNLQSPLVKHAWEHLSRA